MVELISTLCVFLLPQLGGYRRPWPARLSLPCHCTGGRLPSSTCSFRSKEKARFAHLFFSCLVACQFLVGRVFVCSIYKRCSMYSTFEANSFGVYKISIHNCATALVVNFNITINEPMNCTRLF